MSGQLVKDKVPATRCDEGKKLPVVVLDKNMFAIELARNLAFYHSRLHDSISQLDHDSIIADIANIQLCLKHLCDAWDISQTAVEHVYTLMHQQEGGYDSRLYQMDENQKE
jgi:hypothetical protein